MSTEIKIINGRKYFTGSSTDTGDVKSSVSFSIAVGDEESGGSAVPSTSVDERLSLAGLLQSEITRFKEQLLNKTLSNIDYDLSQPSTPVNSPLLNHLASANNMRAGREEREILMSKANAEYMKTDIQVKLKDLELKKQSNEYLKESNNQNDAILTMMGEAYLQNEKLINATNRISNHFYELRNTMNSIKESNQKIAEGVESQKQVNEALLKKLNEETAKDISYNGQTYTKTQIEKMESLENLKGATDENNFSLNDALELVEEFLTDGFDIEINPIETLINQLKTDLKTEFNNANIKYNLGLEAMQ